MNLAQRLDAQLPRFPDSLQRLFHAEIAAGNELRDVETGRGPDAGKAAIILYRPFRAKHDPLPDGIAYREDKDRDPMLFGYHSSDDCFAVLYVKFKPVIFQPIVGPTSPDDLRKEREAAQAATEKPPTAAEAARRAKAILKAKRASRAAHPDDQQDDEAAKTRREKKTDSPAKLPPAAAPTPARAPKPPPAAETPLQRFLDSMPMNFDRWHDGLGYDLSALDELTSTERESVESILIQHHPRDWRDIEALAKLNTPRACAEIEKALTSPDPKIRREAMRHSGNKLNPSERERLLLEGLRNCSLVGGVGDAIDEAAEFHPPAVIDALFHGALHQDGQTAVHFAALLFYLHGKADETFDWNHRPFFLKFNTEDRAARKAVFSELCKIVGVDEKKYH